MGSLLCALHLALSYALSVATRYRSYSVPPCLCMVPRWQFDERRLHWASSSGRARFHRSWRLASNGHLSLHPLPQLCQKYGGSFLAGRDDLSRNFSGIAISPNLVLNLCHRPCLAGKGSVSLDSGGPVLKSAPRPRAVWCNAPLSFGPCPPQAARPHMSPPPILSKPLSRSGATAYAV